MGSEFARVKLVSTPLGAHVTQNGQLLAGVTTPADILVEAGKPVRFMLTLPHKVPAVIDTFTPGRGADLVKEAKLVDGVTVKLEASLDGRVRVVNAPHCQNLTTPAECVLAHGNYTVEFTGVFNAHAIRQVVAGKNRIERFEFGFVDAAPGKSIVVGGTNTKHVAFEVGSRQVTVADEAGTHPVVVKVRPGATTIAN